MFGHRNVDQTQGSCTAGIFLIQHLEVSSSSHLTRLGQPESLGTVNVRVHGSTCSELAGIRFESLDRLVCLTIVAFSKPSNTLATLHDQGANLVCDTFVTMHAQRHVSSETARHKIPDDNFVSISSADNPDTPHQTGDQH